MPAFKGQRLKYGCVYGIFLVVPVIDGLTHSFGELSGRQIAQNGHRRNHSCQDSHTCNYLQVSNVLSDCWFNFFFVFFCSDFYTLLSVRYLIFINVDILKGTTWKIVFCFRLHFPLWNGRYHFVDNSFEDMLVVCFLSWPCGRMPRSPCIT